jgi:hypothetical protein
VSWLYVPEHCNQRREGQQGRSRQGSRREANRRGGNVPNAEEQADQLAHGMIPKLFFDSGLMIAGTAVGINRSFVNYV